MGSNSQAAQRNSGIRGNSCTGGVVATDQVEVKQSGFGSPILKERVRAFAPRESQGD
jgi:hypothetical protein